MIGCTDGMGIADTDCMNLLAAAEEMVHECKLSNVFDLDTGTSCSYILFVPEHDIMYRSKVLDGHSDVVFMIVP